MVLEVGAKVSPIAADDQDGVAQKIDFSGVTILYFYPKDDTPGCIKEACQFRDDMGEYTNRGFRVFGVSTDSVDSHKRFAQKHNLNFPLLSDVDRRICKTFDVAVAPTAKRTTYVIVDGTVVYVDPAVQPEGHSRSLLEKIDEVT